MRIGCGLMILLVMLVMAGQAQVADPFDVPEGSVPIIDGTLSSDEWSDALTVPLNEDSTLFLKHAHGYLYLAVQATTMGVPSPLIVRDGKIYVLHASEHLEQPSTFRKKKYGICNRDLTGSVEQEGSRQLPWRSAICSLNKKAGSERSDVLALLLSSST